MQSKRTRASDQRFLIATDNSLQKSLNTLVFRDPYVGSPRVISCDHLSPNFLENLPSNYALPRKLAACIETLLQLLLYTCLKACKYLEVDHLIVSSRVSSKRSDYQVINPLSRDRAAPDSLYEK